MKNRIFLPTSQILQDAFQSIHPSFKQLRRFVPEEFKLAPELQQFCKETFLLRDPTPPIQSTHFSEAKKFMDIINQNVRQLLLYSKNNYVQCLGQQYKDHSLHMKSFNFGKTILQSSLLEKLYEAMKQNGMEQEKRIKWLKDLIYNYTIVMKYKGDFFQVTGQQLPEQLGFKPFEKKKKAGIKNIMSYSTQVINRFQMLYCTHTNRNSGIFRKNIFFDKGVTKSDYFQQVKLLAEKQISVMLPSNILKQRQITELSALMFTFFNKVRDMFHLRRQNNRNTCQFDLLLTRHCRLPENYQNIKKDVQIYIQTEKGSPEELFEKMYSQQTSYYSVYLLLKNVILKTVPKNMIGPQNLQIFLFMLKQFISMKRYQNFKIQDFLSKMNVFKISWLEINYNKKYKKQIINRCRRILAALIAMLFNKLLIPILKLNFYITEKHKQANKLFYYRKPIWVLISKLAMKKFSQSNLEPINQAQYFEIKKTGTDYPEGKLRLMPKKGTFRPIITFNRKRKVQGDFYKATLNQILSDTQLVLRNLKNILGTEVGYCIFDNRQISRKYEEFIKKWRSKGQPKLVYFTLDIKKCYDYIDTNTLVKIIEQTPYIQKIYMLVKYMRLYRNKKPLNQVKTFPYYFNLKQRIHATSLKNDPIKIYQDQVPAINIFLARQKIITRQQIINRLKQLCDGSIIRYKKQMWLQKLGIPQGLNVSGVLCSLYFAYLQKKQVKVQQGLLMRLTDDYLYIGPQQQAINVLTSLLQCARQNNFVFNSEKIAKNFDHPLVKNITDQQYIHWIGKKININTLQIFPALEKSQDKLAYAMNVNINRKQIKGFLKNKLKSLLTNHFSAYFKPHIYSTETQLQNIKLYCKISLSKFFPFLISLHKLKVEGQSQLITKILQITIHQFLIYVCSFHENEGRHYFYHKYLKTVLEQFTEFMKLKRSYYFLQPVEKIFRKRLTRLSRDLKEYQQKTMIQ